MSLLGRIVDERFLEHRRRSTSIAGMIVAAMALVLFEYHLLVDHRWNWELLALGGGFVLVKLTIMAWYYLTD